MSNTHIETVENGFEKADNYRYQMGRYNLAIQHEFYFEAIVIAYAVIEDRLLAFLHYAGVIDRRQQSDQTEHGIYVSSQCQKQINLLLKRNNNQKIKLNTINVKIEIIKNLMKLPEKIGSALSRKSHHISCCDRLIDVGGDELHAGEYLLRYTLRQFLLGDPSGEIDGHIVLQILDCLFCLQFFTFLDIGVDELIGLLNIHTSRNGSEFTNHGYQTDKQVFCLP